MISICLESGGSVIVCTDLRAASLPMVKVSVVLYIVLLSESASIVRACSHIWIQVRLYSLFTSLPHRRKVTKSMAKTNPPPSLVQDVEYNKQKTQKFRGVTVSTLLSSLTIPGVFFAIQVLFFSMLRNRYPNL